jgi:predicted lactoylglutathione lyase
MIFVNLPVPDLRASNLSMQTLGLPHGARCAHGLVS